MKRITTLLMAAVMVIGTAGLASAVEFKASGHMDIAMGVEDNTPDSQFDKDRAEDNFYAAQRFRPKLTMTAEGVTAVFEAQQHQAYWGSDWPVGNNPNVSVRIRQAYIDFKVPSTPVSLKVGYQQLNLPSIWGHPVFEARVGGALATIPFNDNMALAVFYARPAEDREGAIDGTVDPSHNSTDMYGALLPMDFGTVKATPYFVYSKVGVDSSAPNPAGGYSLSGDNDILMVGGVNLGFQPTDALSLKFDAIVTDYDSDVDVRDYGTGFMFAAAVDYEMPFGTPGFFGWYATGKDDDGEKALFSYQTDGFGPTTMAAAGAFTFTNDSWVTVNGVSTWGAGLQIADMSFVDSLKHTVRVAYIQGTADKDLEARTFIDGSNDWTEKDSFITFDVDSTWSIYENLAAVVELGGLIPDLGSDAKDNYGFEDDFAWRAQLTFRFSF